MKVLIVEDNRNLGKAIEKILKKQGFSCVYFWDWKEAWTYWRTNHSEIDMVVLDVMLPNMSGIEICTNIRKNNINTPVIMLSAKWETPDKVNGLNCGADDYLSKPFESEELIARIQSLLRRPQEFKSNEVKIWKTILYNENSRKVTISWKEVSLTWKEFEILSYLLRKQNTVVSQQEIFDHCFDFAKDNWSNTIEVHIKNLRKKLFYDEKCITTVRWVGYMLEN